MSDLLFLEPLLVERIRSRVLDLRRVVAAMELGDATRGFGLILESHSRISGNEIPNQDMDRSCPPVTSFTAGMIRMRTCPRMRF